MKIVTDDETPAPQHVATIRPSPGVEIRITRRLPGTTGEHYSVTLDGEDADARFLVLDLAKDQVAYDTRGG